MPGIAYVNGRYIPHESAGIHIEDRGFQFADAVYEVWYCKDGTLFDFDGHIKRLERSLGEIGMPMPMSPKALAFHLKRVARLNRVKEGIIYLQVSRGQAPRDHAFPNPAVKQTLVITARTDLLAAKNKTAAAGVAVITCPDERGTRRDIKGVGLLPNILAKQAARKRGAAEAWLVDENGQVTEGSSSSAWIVGNQGQLITRHIDRGILRGITRASLLDIIESQNLTIEERPFTVTEAKAASEAFITSATNLVMPVVRVDDVQIADGRPGALSLRLREQYLKLFHG